MGHALAERHIRGTPPPFFAGLTPPLKMERVVFCSAKSRTYVCVTYEKANRWATQALSIGPRGAMIKKEIADTICYKDGGTTIYKTADGFTFTKAQARFKRDGAPPHMLQFPNGKKEALVEVADEL